MGETRRNPRSALAQISCETRIALKVHLQGRVAKSDSENNRANMKTLQGKTMIVVVSTNGKGGAIAELLSADGSIRSVNPMIRPEASLDKPHGALSGS
jgi:hypothetical protein